MRAFPAFKVLEVILKVAAWLALFLGLAMCAAMAYGQEINLVGPDEPILPGDWTKILVTTTGDVKEEKINPRIDPPNDGVLLIKYVQGSQRLILVLTNSTADEGEFRVIVESDMWMGDLASAILGANANGVEDPEIEQLESIHEGLVDRYIPISAECRVEIGQKEPEVRVDSLSVFPLEIEKGDSAEVKWSTSPPEASVTLNGEGVQATGSKAVSPIETTAYSVIVSHAGKIATESVTLKVLKPDNPIDVSGLHVLIVEDRAARSNLSDGHNDILLSSDDGSVLEWLKKNCAKDSTGVPAYRILDVDQDLSKNSDSWKEVWSYYKKNHSGKAPWMIASSDSDIFDGPLPDGREEAIEILEGLKK